MALQIRRGPTTDRTGKRFVQGELVLDTTLNQVFVGDSTDGGVTGTLGGRPVTAYTDENAVDAVGAALVAGTHQNIAFTYSATQDGANRIDATVTLDGTYNDVIQDTSPQLGGDLDLNEYDITGTGSINVTGSVTATSFSGPLTGAVTGNVTGNVTGDLTGNADTVTDGIYTGHKFFIGTEEIDISRATSPQTLAGVSIDGNAGGNAATATKLAATKNINGVPFDGSADVTVITQGTGVSISGTAISIGQAVATTSNVTFNNLTVSGDLTVNGTTTTLNTTTLDVEDKNITIANGATSSLAADGAGITIEGANATLTYEHIGTKFVFNKAVDATSFTGNVTGDVVGNVTGDVTSVGANTFGSITVTGGDANHASIALTGYNEARAGLGYHEFLQVTNTYSSAANPNRYFRLNSDGDLEVLNSGYSSVILSISNDGNITTTGTINATGIITSDAGFSGTLTGSVKTLSIDSPSFGQQLIIAAGTTFNEYVDFLKGVIVGQDYCIAVTGYRVISSPSPSATVNIELTNTEAVFNVPVRFGSYTLTQRNALTPSVGDVIYCTNSGPGGIGQFVGYANGAWVSLS
jgi:hypothetical protein